MTPRNNLDPDEIQKDLNTQIIGKELFCFQETGSTQTVAHTIANGGGAEGTLILTESQTEGKGRRGRSWHSSSGKGIWASLILRPEITLVQAGRVSLCVGVAIAEAIRKITGLSATIKWPNDILVAGKKVGGTLIEITAETDLVKYIILGFGINVNQDSFPADLRDKALSLKQALGKEVSRLMLVREILQTIDRYYLSLKSGKLEMITERWENLSSIVGKQVRITLRGETIEGEASGVDADGALLLRLDSGFTKHIIGGEITLLS